MASENNPSTKAISPKRIAFIVVPAAILAWMFFHPDKVASIAEADPDAVIQAAKLLPGLRENTGTVRLKFNQVNVYGTTVREVAISKAAQGVALKNSRRYDPKNSTAVVEENSSLYMGPVPLLRHRRFALRFVGNLFPFALWTTAKFTALNAQASPDFPHKVGARFTAKSAYRSTDDDRGFETGSFSSSCEVLEQAEANRLLPSLSGNAFRFRCLEEWQGTGETDKDAWSYEEWYLEDLGVMFTTKDEYLGSTQRTSDIDSTITTRQLVEVSIE